MDGHDWQAESAWNSSHWLNNNVTASGTFVSSSESRYVTETGVIFQDTSFTDICQTVGTFPASWSIKISLTALLCWSCLLEKKKRHYLIKSSNSDSGDRFIPPKRQHRKLFLLRVFHFSFQRATSVRVCFHPSGVETASHWCVWLTLCCVSRRISCRSSFYHRKIKASHQDCAPFKMKLHMIFRI